MTAFSPPDGMAGTAALICGLSADASTIGLILSEFTGENDSQRRSRGRATAVLAVDRRSRRWDLRTIGGLFVAEPILLSWPEGSMLHAKVALLGYAVDPSDSLRRIRLVVSTGNWTAASLSTHIDMLWIVDLDLKSSGAESERKDIAAAAGMFRDLLFGKDALFQKIPSSTGADELLAACLTDVPSGQSRFIHSMYKPLLGQIGRRFKPAKSPWNWLYAGSGFFEQAVEAEPIVLTKIDAQLTKHVTKKARRHVVINPEQPGAFATKSSPNWTICEPVKDEQRAFMHAKFIAAGRQVRDSHHDVTVYLGSGNLSKSGLLTAFGTSRCSRIEAGVVFSAGTYADDALWKILPNSVALDEARLKGLVAVPAETDDQSIPPPPVLYAQLHVQEGLNRSRLRLQKATPEVSSQIRLGDSIFELPIGVVEIEVLEFADAYLDVRILGSVTWEAVPVIGSDGSFARVKLPPSTVEDVLELLIAFPYQPEFVSEEDGLDTTLAVVAPSQSRRSNVESYPARDAMRLIEEIAKLATAAAEVSSDRVLIITRLLRRSLIEGLRTQDKQAFAALGVNFTAALKEMPGLPTGPDWLSLVDDLAADWGLLNKPALALGLLNYLEVP